MSPQDVLDAAADLLQRRGLANTGAWPRAVALLTRQALEMAVDEFWSSTPATTALRRCSRKTQFLCLPTYLDAAMARRASYTWSALSNACHYHPYELAPTGSELRGWIDAVAALLTEMSGSPK